MVLPSDLISEFVEVTNDKTEIKKETTVYGTVVVQGDSKYVRLDGSDLLTPISLMADVDDGERVAVMIKNHSAIVTGNISSPSAKYETVEVLGQKLTEAEEILADKVSTTELEAERARIENLVAENVTIKGRLEAGEASISELEADNVTINETLTAHKADIESLDAKKLNASDAEITYATIENLNATNAQVHNLEADYGDFVQLTTDNFEATNADITNLKAKKLDADEADMKYATIDNLEATDAYVYDLEADYGTFKNATASQLTAAVADINDLKANKLNAADADIKYANIDFSNIGKAAFEYFYANSGLIRDVIVDNGTITGNLVGVTISGDLIEGNTIKADRLVIKGSDGLYYKLNTDGVTTSSEQTDSNSLNGSVIRAKTITATQISVSDLVAFDATIGGFNITENSIYSGVKESVDNTTRGIYMDNTGQIAFGDTNNFIKFYKGTDGTFKLAISAQSIKFGASNRNLETVMGETIVSTVEQFYQSTSPIVLSGGSWSTEQPTWTEGTYIWRRAAVTHGDGSSEYVPSSTGVCITGNTGAKGDDSILLMIESSNGNIFKNSGVATTLTANIIVGDSHITCYRQMQERFGAEAYLQWSYKRLGETEFTDLPNDDPRISDNGFIFTLNPSDVDVKTVFNCSLNY